MRLIRSFVGLIVLWVTLDSCFKAPEFPEQPEISFNSIVFKDVADPSVKDSLYVTVNFKDGDGDLGLNGSEVNSPFNEKYYYRFPNGAFLNYAAKRLLPAFDTLPEFVTPYNCTNWEVISDPSSLNCH